MTDEQLDALFKAMDARIQWHLASALHAYNPESTLRNAKDKAKQLEQEFRGLLSVHR